MLDQLILLLTRNLLLSLMNNLVLKVDRQVKRMQRKYKLKMMMVKATEMLIS